MIYIYYAIVRKFSEHIGLVISIVHTKIPGLNWSWNIREMHRGYPLHIFLRSLPWPTHSLAFRTQSQLTPQVVLAIKDISCLSAALKSIATCCMRIRFSLWSEYAVIRQSFLQKASSDISMCTELWHILYTNHKKNVLTGSPKKPLKTCAHFTQERGKKKYSTVMNAL